MRVLIVDSSTLIVKRLEEMLLVTETTQHVYSSDSYATGLEIFEICNPDVVLLGIGIPEEKSIKFLSSIKTLNKATAVVILALNINDELHAQCVELGADFFLDKYYEFEEIPGLIQRIAAREA